LIRFPMTEAIKAATYLPDGSSSKWTVIGCVAFIYVGIRMEPDIGGVGYLVAVFFSMILAGSVIRHHPKAASLRIDGQGFTVCRLFRETVFPWSQVDHFYVTTLWNEDQKAVVCVMASDWEHTRSGSTGKTEKRLPDTYGMTAEELAGLLNSCLTCFRAASR